MRLDDPGLEYLGRYSIACTKIEPPKLIHDLNQFHTALSRAADQNAQGADDRNAQVSGNLPWPKFVQDQEIGLEYLRQEYCLALATMPRYACFLGARDNVHVQPFWIARHPVLYFCGSSPMCKLVCHCLRYRGSW